MYYKDNMLEIEKLGRINSGIGWSLNRPDSPYCQGR